MDFSADELLEVGAVVGTHGLRGDLKVRALPTGDLALPTARDLILKDKDGRLSLHPVTRNSLHKNNHLIRLAGLEHIDAAQGLVGQSVWMRTSDLPDLPEEQHFWNELEGLDVVDATFGRLGRVVGMFTTPAHDILEVKGEKGETLIPALPEFIVDVDHENRTLRVDLPDGMVAEKD